MAFAVPYVDLPAEYASLRREALDRLDDVLSRGAFILRDEVHQLEQRLAKRLGTAHVVGVGSGHDALFLTLKALGIGPGHEVIVPAYTFVATAATVAHTGATPVFADILPDLNMDPAHAASLVGPRTRAIIPVHLSGRPCRMDELAALAREHGLHVVEDAAQAMGSTLDGRALGSLGAAGCFSLHPLKLLSVPGDGGFVATDDDVLAEALGRLRDHGRLPGGDHLLGYNSRLDNLHAALALIKLDHLDQWIEARRRAAGHYARALADIPDLVLPSEPPGSVVAWSTYPVLSPRADDLERALIQGGVECFRHFRTPAHRTTAFAGCGAALPVTERLCDQAVYLPMHPFLSEEHIETVALAARGGLA